jgi:WhiB family transcriptional regulator, redox-sensing transcriptional regulator
MAIVPAQNVAEPPRAACVGTDQDLWFSRDGETAAAWRLRAGEALAICTGCPIRQACLDEALACPISQQHGVFGGMGDWQRRELLAAPERAA